MQAQRSQRPYSRLDRQLLYVPLLQPKSHATRATEDSVLTFTQSVAVAQLAFQEGHDSKLRSEVLVPPAFLIAIAYPVPKVMYESRFTVSSIVEIECTWFRSVKVNEPVKGLTTVEEACEAEGSSFLLRSSTTYTSESADVVACTTTTTINSPAKILPTVTANTIDFPSTPNNDVKDGSFSTPFHSTRIAVGDILIRSDLRPITEAHLALWNKAVGDVDEVRPLFNIAAGIGTAESYLARPVNSSHSDEDERVQDRLPRSENGTRRFAIIAEMMGKWVANAGTLEKLKVLYEAPHAIGDAIRYTATVQEVRFVAQEVKIVAQIIGVNQYGIRSTVAYASCTLQVSPSAHAPLISGLTGHASEKCQRLNAPKVMGVVARVLQLAESNPDKVAIYVTNGLLTFKELDTRSLSLACDLKRAGMEPLDTVGILLPRTLELILTMFALLRSRHTYLVLDPEYPQNRLLQMMSLCSAVVCDSTTIAAGTALHGNCWSLESLRSTEMVSRPPPLVSEISNRSAYLMFTSGSSGVPRAAEISEQSLDAAIESMQELGYESSDICLHTASFSFSASVRQLYTPLTTGATVVLATTEETRDPEARLSLMRRHHVTIWDTTPSALEQTMLHLDRIAHPPLTGLLVRQLFVTGELLSSKTVTNIMKWLPCAMIVNLYSQTESTGTVCAHVLRDNISNTEGLVPAGKALSGVTVMILNPSLGQSPPFEEGEIFIQTNRLADGYRDAPRESELSFLEGIAGAGGRWYRTGDHGFLDGNNSLTVTGRLDSVRNVRGVKISLGEVEAVIGSHTSVANSAVVADRVSSPTQSFTAFVVAKGPGRPGEQLRSELYGLLPASMRPKKLIFLEELPRLPNMKVDRRRLADWQHPKIDQMNLRRTSDDPQDVREYRSPLEIQVIALIEKETGVRIAVTEPLIDSGLDSLGMVRLAATLDGWFGCDLTLTSIYRASNVRQLAAVIRGASQRANAAIVDLAGSGDGNPLFYVPGLNGHPHDFLRMARCLGQDRKIYGLEYPCATLNSLPALAAYFMKQICDIKEKGPYLLCGHSLGGRVAFEIAKQLAACDRPVAGVILIDASAPVIGVKGHTLKRIRIALRLSKRISGLYKRRGLVGATRHALARPNRPSQDPGFYATGSRAQLLATQVADDCYRPSAYRGHLILLKANRAEPLSEGIFGSGSDYGWDKLATAGVTIVPVMGGHSSCIRDEHHIQDLAPRLRAVLRGTEAGF